MSKPKEHCVSVAGGRYTFVRVEGREGVKLIDRSDGEPFISWVNDAPAVTAIMCELDAARGVVEAARSLAVQLNRATDSAFEIVAKSKVGAAFLASLTLHDRLVSDHEPPSAWCGAEYAERVAAEKQRSTESSQDIYGIVYHVASGILADRAPRWTEEQHRDNCAMIARSVVEAIGKATGGQP